MHEQKYPGFRMTADERIAEMDALGVDAQVLSPTVGFYMYDQSARVTAVIARECNDEIAELVTEYRGRFYGLGTLPMQDVPTATAELERVMGPLGLHGVEIGDHVNGRNYDEEAYLPFWETAERLGAVVFVHQGNDNRYRIGKYFLDNAVGNLVERTITFGVIAHSGLLDRFPGLKILLAHAGGYAAFGASRMDKAAGAFPEDKPDPTKGFLSPLDLHQEEATPLRRPPSDRLAAFYYDSCTFDGPTLRFLIDRVGISRVVLGTDTPAPMVLTNCVEWINGLPLLSREEKDAILSGNPTRLLGLNATAAV